MDSEVAGVLQCLHCQQSFLHLCRLVPVDEGSHMLAPSILKDLVQQKGWDLMILFSLQNTRTKTGVKFFISKP